MKQNKLLSTLLALIASDSCIAQSLRFFGNGVDDIDRIKIRIDDPADPSDQGPPADIGAEDFTIEFWLKPEASNRGVVECGANNNWISGNIVIDRDRWRQGRKFGISLGTGRIVFGVVNAENQAHTFCGSSDLRDGSWHHVAVQRRIADGHVTIFVDGVREVSMAGPVGDVSYPDDGIPGNFCGGPCDNSDPFIVIGAEKHDVGPEWPAYSGWFDELRLSNVIRYEAEFTPLREPFVPDSGTVALYHFDNVGGAEDRVIIDSAFLPAPGRSPGERKFGGGGPFWKFWAPPPGPAWSSDSPFTTP